MTEARRGAFISAYGLPERVAIETLAVSPLNKDHLFAGTSAGLYESQTGGFTGSGLRTKRLADTFFLSCFWMIPVTGSWQPKRHLPGFSYSKDAGQSWDKIRFRGLNRPSTA
jgi:hypothetical protein